MKKNIMSNYDMDKYMIENGINLKACDFEDDGIKMMIPRRRHTTTEKNKANVKWRVDFTGKKHHKDRTREDYKMAKVENKWKRDYRSYSRGGYDRNGIIQNRRDIEATKDAMSDIYGKDDADRDANYFASLVEAKESLECYIRQLELEVDEVAFMDYQFRKWAMESARTHGFKFRPRVKVDSWAEEALENARASLAEMEEDIDKFRKGVK